MNLSGFLKGVIYTSFAIVPLLVWFVSESTFFPYITGKNFSFRFLIEISFIAWVALAALEPAYRPKRSLVFYSYSAFLVIICIANILGVNPYLSFFSNFERSEGWFTHLHLFIYFTILYSVYKTDKDWMRAMGWFIVGNIAVSAQAVLQALGQKDFFVTKLYGAKVADYINVAYPTSMGNGLRLDSTLGNSAYYGIYTLFFAFIGVMLAAKTKKWRGVQGWRAIWMVVGSSLLVLFSRFIEMANANGTATSFAGAGTLVWFIGMVGLLWGGFNLAKKFSEGEVGSWPMILVGLLNAFLLVYTQTRGSYLGLVLGTIVSAYCLITFYLSKKTKTKSTKIAVILGSTVVTFVLIPMLMVSAFEMVKASKFANESVFLKRLTTINIPTISQASNSIANDYYPDMLKTFGEITIVSRVLNGKMSIDGWSETLKTKVIGYGQENYSTVFAEHYDPRMYKQEPWFDRAHNVFFDWLVAGGVLGLVAYLALYLTPIYMLWGSKGRNNMSVTERSLLTGLLVGYFVHNIFVFDNLISLIMFVLVLAYIASRTRDTDSHIKEEFKNKKHVSNAVMYTYLAAASVVSIGLFTYTVFKPLSANLDVLSALRITSALSKYEDVPVAVNKSLAYFKSAVETGSYGKNEIAEQMLSQVSSFSNLDLSKIPEKDKVSTAKDLAEFQALAEKEMLELIQAHPNARNLSLYSMYLRYTNHLAEAKEYGARAVELAPNKQGIVGDYIDTLFANNDYALAYEFAKKMYNSEPTYQFSLEKYIEAAAKAGDKKEAKAKLEMLRSQDPESAKRLDASLVALLK